MNLTSGEWKMALRSGDETSLVMSVMRNVLLHETA